MTSLTWTIKPTSQQTQQLWEVYSLAFLDQGRSSLEHLKDYFHTKIIPRLKSGQLLLLAFHQEEMVGFILFEKWEAFSYYIAEMAIAPKAQRQGLGKKLMFAIFEKDPAIHTLFLVTETSNRDAQAFYQKIGFLPSTFQHPDYPKNFIGYEFKK